MVAWWRRTACEVGIGSVGSYDVCDPGDPGTAHAYRARARHCMLAVDVLWKFSRRSKSVLILAAT